MATREGTGSGVAGVIQVKCRVPSVSDRSVERRRLTRVIAGLAARNRPLAVYATAGSGKTTAVVHALPEMGRPVAWLTVDETDAAPGRFLTYLEAALAVRVPTAAGIASTALRRRIPHREAAGLLAESLADEPLVLVIDEIERIVDAKDALAVLGAFLRYAPPSVQVILVSRRELPLELASSAPFEAVALREDELAFTTEEAGAALAGWGRDGVDPAAAVEVTGGWVAGVLFEAWRSADHVASLGGEADPLHGYLASQVLDQLPADEQRFLIATSLLPEVTPARADHLGQKDAAATLAALRTKHLPVTWADGAMRCHPRFREYLFMRLERRPRREVTALIEAYGEQLEQEGLYEDAVEQYLRAGSLEHASRAAGAALDAIVERLDFGVAERWLEALAPVARPGDDKLTRPRLMLAIAHERYRAGARIADELAALGERELLAARSPSTASMMAWCYFHVGRLDDVYAVLDAAGDGNDLDAAFVLSLLDSTGAHASFDPDLSGGPLDALIMRVRYIHGRLREVAEPPSCPWAAAVTAPWRVGALRALGNTDQALELYETEGVADCAPVWFHAIVAPELMTDLGRLQDARQALARGRSLIRQSGSVVYDMLNRLIEAKLELWLQHDHERAYRVLRRLEERPEASSYGLIAEQVGTWMGMVHLLRGEDADAARRLRDAVRSMRAMDRPLELPAAAVLLAEADWRLGRQEEADAAADAALEAARRQGSYHGLLQALERFPAVASRRLDAELHADSPWHEIGRSLLARGAPIAGERAHARLVDLGEPAILVDGARARPRIKKTYELLAYLSVHAGRHVDREELLTALFDGRDDESTRSYLRQAVQQLRDVLPESSRLAFEGGRLRLGDGFVLQSESARAEALLARAMRIRGPERLDLLLGAVAVLDQGEYLAGVRSVWAEERRAELAGLAADARHEAAQSAFEAGRYREAEALASAVLRADPYREATWRLLMRVASALGDDDRVIAMYRRCQRTLSKLGVSPSRSTTALLEALRR